MENQQNWWQLSSIQIGAAVCLPVIMIGQTLAQTYGLKSAVAAILLGNAILLLLGIVTAKMSCDKRKTTMENAKDFFGERGVRFFSLAMVISLIGWFAIQLNVMSLSVLDLFSIDNTDTWLLALNIGLGLLITLSALKGIKALNLLADLSLPLLFFTLCYSLYTHQEVKSTAPSVPLSFNGTSIVIAMAIALVIDLPTYFRHASSHGHGFISILLIFGLALPFLEIAGVYLASGSEGNDILDILKGQNGALWNLWIALFLILAGWTTNNLNLYSAVVCLEITTKNVSEIKRTLAIGAIATALSCFNMLNHFELVLDIIGILIASMGAVVLTRFLILLATKTTLAPVDQKRHLYAWALGIAFGLFGVFGLSLSSISVLDAMFGASAGTFLTLSFKGSNEKAYA